jgi:hypothetical protein
VGGLGESDPGCIFVVKYVLLYSWITWVLDIMQAVLRVIHTAHREHAWDWENLMFVYLCHIDISYLSIGFRVWTREKPFVYLLCVCVPLSHRYFLS